MTYIEVSHENSAGFGPLNFRQEMVDFSKYYFAKKVNRMTSLINPSHHMGPYVMRGLSLTAAVFEPTTKNWQIGHKLPHMPNEGNFGLRKILKISQG